MKLELLEIPVVAEDSKLPQVAVIPPISVYLYTKESINSGALGAGAVILTTVDNKPNEIHLCRGVSHGNPSTFAITSLIYVLQQEILNISEEDVLIEFYLNSQYLADTLAYHRIQMWEKNAWIKLNGGVVKNVLFWMEVNQLLKRKYKVLPYHTGNPRYQQIVEKIAELECSHFTMT